MSLHRAHWCPSVQFEKLSGNCIATFSPTVNPKAAAPLPRMSPNPFSWGLSISSCRVCNTLPRCHYCTITYQIPPVYYHYRSMSAIINDGSTPSNERVYWLTEGVGGVGLPRQYQYFYYIFVIFLKILHVFGSKLGQRLLHNSHSRCYLKSRFAAGIQVSGVELAPPCVSEKKASRWSH